MASVALEGWDELQTMLTRIDDRLAKRARNDAVKAGGEVVAVEARVQCPRGDPTSKPELKALAETIGVEVKDYGARSLAVVGPQWPAGAHGHLVEYGHDIVARGEGKAGGPKRAKGGKKHEGKTTGRAKANPFLRRAFDSTSAQQVAAIEGVVKQALTELGAG